MLDLTPQVAHVTAEGSIAPNPEEVVDAILINHLGISLQQGTGGDGGAVQPGDALEALRSKQADAPIAKYIVHKESKLAQSAAALISFEVNVLKAAKSASLYVSPTVYKTDIELAFLMTGVIHVFALRLHG